MNFLVPLTIGIILFSTPLLTGASWFLLGLYRKEASGLLLGLLGLTSFATVLGWGLFVLTLLFMVGNTSDVVQSGSESLTLIAIDVLLIAPLSIAAYLRWLKRNAMTYVLPPLVTEHEPGIDDDCTPCSGVMQLLARFPGRCSPTLTSAEAIRKAAGVPDGVGMNTPELITGITKLFGAAYAPTGVTSWPAAWAAAVPGKSLTISGIPANAPVGSPIREWVGALNAGHRIFGARLDALPRMWIMDPEGPADGAYKGQWCRESDLAAFAKDPTRQHSLQSLLAINHSVHIAANAIVKIATVSGGCIAKWTDYKWGSTASSAPCTAKYVLKVCTGGPATVVQVTAGVFSGKVIHVGTGVSVT